MAQRINTETFETEVLHESTPVLVDFYSDSCVPCKRMSPLLAELERDYPQVKIVKVNIQFDIELAERYAILSVPSLLLFRNGQETARLSGIADRQAIEKILQE